MHKLTSHHWYTIHNTLESPLLKAIHSITKALEDLLLNAMEGANVSDLACGGLLLYQVAPDVML